MKADMMKTSLIYTQNKNGEQKVKNKIKNKTDMLSRNVAGQKFVESVLTRKGGRSGWWGNLWKNMLSADEITDDYGGESGGIDGVVGT